MEVRWIKSNLENDIPLQTYQSGKVQPENMAEEYQKRTELFTEQLSTGNVSLKLKNVQVSDTGKYTCLVNSENWFEKSIIDFHSTSPHDDKHDNEEETPTLHYDVPRASITQVSAASRIPVHQAETGVGTTPVISVSGYEDGGIRLQCTSEGWYPRPDVTWAEKNSNLTANSITIVPVHNGLYKVETYVVKQSAEKQISCIVRNNLTKEEWRLNLEISGQ
ncbi:butyrophilin subfamily 3 member A2-like [Latimeria chalumnae]|uniref:butyrophilin subfamily 3 member A2-like n=1 Tax=Latimeria chalumnae TaxID=7897 RepID=UPI00313D7568